MPEPHAAVDADGSNVDPDRPVPVAAPNDAATADAAAGMSRPEAEAPSRRPLIERLGMAAIALVLAALFGAMAAAAFGGGEPFLGVMAATGALMTLWVGGLTLIRG